MQSVGYRHAIALQKYPSAPLQTILRRDQEYLYVQYTWILGCIFYHMLPSASHDIQRWLLNIKL